MINVDFANDVVSITLPNREILMRHDELHKISEAYTRFYIKESVEAYLKRHDREDLTDCIEEIINNIHKDIKHLLDDSETITSAILDATGESV
jgi:Mg2+ and Co2+ transporter CorA